MTTLHPLCGLFLVTALAPAAHPQCFMQLSSSRIQTSTVSHGDLAFFAGGVSYDNVPSSRVDVYADSTGAWQRYELSQARWHSVGVGVEDLVLFAGGSAGSGAVATVDVLDTVTGQMTATELSLARDGLAGAAAGGTALFGGGIVGNVSVATVDLFDAASGTWTTSALSEPRHLLAAAGVGSKVLFAGGRTGPSSGESDVVDIYDTVTGAWSQATLSQPRRSLVGASVGSKVLFAGGWNDGQLSMAVDIYDDLTGTWSTATLPGASVIAATTLGSRVLFAGSPVIGGLGLVVYDDDLDLWWTASLAGNGWFAGAATAGGTALFGTRAAVFGPARTLIEPLTAELPSPFCFGDSSGTACPCLNPGAPGAGCANSTGAGGTMRPSGGQCAEVDELLLICEGLVPGRPALLLAGEDDVAGGAGAPFGDGLFCVDGNVVRLPTVDVPGSGELTFGYGLQDAFGWGPGDTRRFQVVYRDPTGPCGSGFNATNGVEVRFQP